MGRKPHQRPKNGQYGPYDTISGYNLHTWHICRPQLGEIHNRVIKFEERKDTTVKQIELTKEQATELTERIVNTLEKLTESEKIYADIELDNGIYIEAEVNADYTWKPSGCYDYDWDIFDATVHVELTASDEDDEYEVKCPFDLEAEIVNQIV